MLKRKCPGCAEKIEKKFNFCPWCGHSVKKYREEADFGLLGRSDDIEQNKNNFNNQLKLPFGLGKMVDSLIKQLEKELSGMEGQSGNFPKGFNIRIQTQRPNQAPMAPLNQKRAPQNFVRKNISVDELNRRKTLPKKEAESKVRRLSDKIIYEIETPGVKSKDDIVITKLEQGFEIKVYAKDVCYTKIIPLQVDIDGYSFKKDKVFVELKN